MHRQVHPCFFHCLFLPREDYTCFTECLPFERRFIYKIEFKRPSLEVKQMIWKSMIPSLSDETALSLAKGYDLSGGQIENIARKCTVEYILSGNEPSNAQMKEFCESESMDSRQPARKKIGF